MIQPNCTWAIYHNLGGGLKLYYEAINDLDMGSRVTWTAPAT